VSFPSPKAERHFFRSSGSPRCAGKTHVFVYEPELPLARAVEENVSFPSAKAEQHFFRSSGTPRCARKTHVFGYEPELPLAHAVKDNNSTAFIPLSPFLCPHSFVYTSANLIRGPMAQ
jgi:hypothetical protein